MHPVRAGFRAVLCQPALLVAELAWRWAFGAAAWALILLSVHRFLSSMTVSQAEVQLARTWQPFLVADVVARILAANWAAALRATVILVVGIFALWIFAVTVGRAATLKALLAQAQAEPAVRGRTIIVPLLVLHSFRAAISLAALVAWVGGLMLVGASVPNPQDNPGLVLLVGFGILFLVGLFWSIANWFLALAPIFIVRDARGALAAVADSFGFYSSRTSAYLSVASWFGLLRFLALFFALMFSLIPIGMVGQASPAAIVITVIVLSLAYFAFADFLYVSRLAAFVFLASETTASVVAAPQAGPSPAPILKPEA
jgi:hypothetical protein